MVSNGAHVAVVTFSDTGCVDASELGIARIHGARVRILAINRVAGHAGPGLAEVVHGTDAAILAGALPWFVNTSGVGLTQVVGARIAVVAVGRGTGLAGTFEAEVANGALVAIFARESVVGRCE